MRGKAGSSILLPQDGSYCGTSQSHPQEGDTEGDRVLGGVREYQVIIQTHPILRLGAPVHPKGVYPLRVGSSGSGVLPEELYKGR